MTNLNLDRGSLSMSNESLSRELPNDLLNYKIIPSGREIVIVGWLSGQSPQTTSFADGL